MYIHTDVIVDNEYTKTISGVWAIDDDINRFLKFDNLLLVHKYKCLVVDEK